MSSNLENEIVALLKKLASKSDIKVESLPEVWKITKKSQSGEDTIIKLSKFESLTKSKNTTKFR